MGEAKRRGPRDQRVKEGVEKAIAIVAERKRKEAEAEAALTSEQRAKRKKARSTLAMLTGLTLSMSSNLIYLKDK